MLLINNIKLSVDADSDTDVALFTINATKDDADCGAFTAKSLSKIFEDGETLSVSNVKDCTYTLNDVRYLYSHENDAITAAKCYKVSASATTVTVGSETSASACTTAG